MRGADPSFPIALGILFCVGWIATAAFVSHVGGWALLAGSFRAAPGAVANRRFFCSGSLGIINYNACLIRAYSSEGLFLAVLPPFRPFHPPLFIPWSAMSRNAERSYRSFMRTWVDITVGSRLVRLGFSTFRQLPFEAYLPRDLSAVIGGSRRAAR